MRTFVSYSQSNLFKPGCHTRDHPRSDTAKIRIAKQK